MSGLLYQLLLNCQKFDILVENLGTTSLQTYNRFEMGDKLDVLIEWLASSNEFYLSENVTVVETKGSGRGLRLRSREIKCHQAVISVPESRQLNFHTVLKHLAMFNKHLKDMGGIYDSEVTDLVDHDDPRFMAYGIFDQDSVMKLTSFQLLTLYILFEWVILSHWNFRGIVSFWQPFFNVFPEDGDFRSIPCRWLCDSDSQHRTLFNKLPKATQDHAFRIKTLLENDWHVLLPYLLKWQKLFTENGSPVFTLDETYERFLHIYFIINSRCLYMDISEKSDAADKFTMVPFVDFLNHAPEVNKFCQPRQNSRKLKNSAFIIECGPYAYRNLHEELFLNYGAHSNDFLMNEYGFVLKENNWNYLDVTADVETLVIDKEYKDFLIEKDYWGDLTIAFEFISFRLLVTVALLASKDVRKVEKFILGFIGEDSFQPGLNAVLHQLLCSLNEQVVKKREDIKTLSQCDEWCLENVLTIYQGYEKIIIHHLESRRP
ncbi:LAMI_0H18888g1_1 [Lachancea mirantina]|uniref:LAMI_0H18888g1_1 n=1 Tax=Lachancea mirantina TaxID=1230905 RepID=A0A1G4KJV4_9SACH|nr:LAMI_0H18888g1_1 [Lachancea mirantina]